MTRMAILNLQGACEPLDALDGFWYWLLAIILLLEMKRSSLLAESSASATSRSQTEAAKRHDFASAGNGGNLRKALPVEPVLAGEPNGCARSGNIAVAGQAVPGIFREA